jgi:predicted transcriptional regulator YheO
MSVDKTKDVLDKAEKVVDAIKDVADKAPHSPVVKQKVEVGYFTLKTVIRAVSSLLNVFKK